MRQRVERLRVVIQAEDEKQAVRRAEVAVLKARLCVRESPKA